MINKLLLITLAFLLWATPFIFGQSIATTKATAGWNPEYVGSTIVVSNKSGFNYPAQPGVYPWHSAPMPPPASLSLTYLSLQADGTGHYGDGGMSTTITGLIPGYDYTIKCSIMASLYFYNGGATTTQWPASAHVVVNNGVYVTKSDVIFSPGINTNKWLQQSITFRAKQATASFYLGIKVPSDAKGVVSLDMISDPIDVSCTVGGSTINLSTTALPKKCPQSTVNLNNTYSGGALPPNVSLLWFTNQTHSGSPVNNVVSEPATYYAFLFDTANNCWNTDFSTTSVFVSTPIILFNTNSTTATIQLTCNGETFDLNTVIDNLGSLPAGASIVWFDNPTHSGTKYQTPGTAAPGTYYAFIYYGSQNNCYNTDYSSHKVSIKPAEPVVLGYNSTQVICSTSTAKLPATAVSGVPDGSVLRYYTNAGAIGAPFTDWQNAPVGDYYAFSFNQAKQCLNTGYSTTKFSIKAVPQVALLSESISNVCPAPTVDLHSLEVVVPSGAVVKWFIDDAHVYPVTGNVWSGTYYAFYYDQSSNCFNTNKSTAKVTVTATGCAVCNAGTNQAFAETVISLGCGKASVDLMASVVPPAGTELVFYDNPTHTGTPLANTNVGAGTYYAFFHDAVNNCFNTDNSTAKLDVIGFQVQGIASSLSVACPGTTVDLADAYSEELDVVWFNNATHAGQPISDPSKVGTGDYYAFIFCSVTGTYLPDVSTSKVTVTIPSCIGCTAGTAQVQLNTNKEVIKFCPSTTINLDSYFSGVVPAGSSLVWFDNNGHLGNPLSTIQSPSDYVEYYAFFFDAVNNCYNTDKSEAVLKVKTNFQVLTLGCNDIFNCSPIISCNQTFNLTNVIPSTSPYDPFPASVKVVWFDNESHSGSPIANPTAVNTSGTYYAFYYDSGNDCYNKAISTATVHLTVLSCATTVQLGIKVALQGSMPGAGTMMRNDLQKYTDQTIVGILPTKDPYENLANCFDINNQLGVVGRIVDWVKVEIKSTVSPFTVLQSRNLLLKADGNVVDVYGQVPSFSAQAGNVFIVVKHRNHLAVRSASIPFAAGTTTYSFTDALNKAYNDGSTPDQMKLVNGIWCMINGDVSQDYFIVNQDVTQTRSAFKTGGVGVYSSRDLNMNGFLENQDVTAQRSRFNAGLFSILSKF
jgi:hypothetical protein